MSNEIMSYLPDADQEELTYISMLINDMEESDKNTFLTAYKKKRQQPQMILIITLVSLVTLGGIQRFMLGQIGMGILYLLTGGLCAIGTIMDAVNHKKLTWEANRSKADETIATMKSGIA